MNPALYPDDPKVPEAKQLTAVMAVASTLRNHERQKLTHQSK